MPTAGNNDVNLGLGFEFDEEAFNKSLEHFLNSIGAKFGGFTVPPPKMGKPKPEDDPVEYAKRTSRTLEEIRKQREERELAAQSLTFKKLEKEYETHSKKVVDLSNQLYEQKHNKESKAEIESTSVMLREEKAKTAILRKEYQSRDEVISHGMGAKFGILGTGRSLMPGISSIAGTVGLGISSAEIFNLGMESEKVGNRVRTAFLAARVPLSEIGAEMQRVNRFSKDWSETLLTTEVELKKVSSEAAILGGFTGKANEEITKMAVSIEQQTGGDITALRFIRGVAKGFLNPDDEQMLGRLKQTWPELADAVKGATDQYDLFNKVMAFSKPIIQGQMDLVKTEAGQVEKATIAAKNRLDELGQALVRLSGNYIQFAEDTSNNFVPKFNFAVHALDKLIEDPSILLQTFVDITGAVTKAAVKTAGELDETWLKEHASAHSASSSVAELASSLYKQADAAHKAMVSNAEYLAGLDDQRKHVEDLKTTAARIRVNLSKGDTSEGTYMTLIAYEDEIKRKGAAIKVFNEAFAKENGIDPSQQESKPISAVQRSAFEKRKAFLEDQMKAEQTIAEANGIIQNKTKTEIEIESLNIEIKYSKLIAEAANKNSQLKNQYLLEAAKAELRIREIAAEQAAHNEDIHFRFILSTSDEYDKKRLELSRNFARDFNNASYEAGLELWEMYKRAWDQIATDESETKIRKAVELNQKLIDAQIKGLDARIKHSKKGFNDEIASEDRVFELKIEKTQRHYEEEKRLAKENSEQLAIIEKEHNADVENLRAEHKDNLRKITEDQNKDIVDIFKNAASDSLSTWEKEFFGPMNGLIGGIAKGFLKLGEQKLVEGIGKWIGGLLGPKKDNAQAVENAAFTVTAATFVINDSNLAAILAGNEGGKNLSSGDGGGSTLPPGYSIDQNGNIVPPGKTNNGAGTNFKVGDKERPNKGVVDLYDAWSKKFDDKEKEGYTNLKKLPNDNGEITKAEEKRSLLDLSLTAHNLESGLGVVAGHLNPYMMIGGSSIELYKRHEEHKENPDGTWESPIERMMREKNGYTDNGMQVQHPKGDGVDWQSAGKAIGKGFTDSTPKDFAKGVLSFIPGGSLIDTILGGLGFAGGGDVPGIDRGYDSVRAKLRPGERILTQTENRQWKKDKELELFSARGMAGGGGSAGNDTLMRSLISRVDAVGQAIESIHFGISGNDLRGAATRAYSDIIGKKMA